MDKPLVSIILPVQNSDLFLEECLESLLKQSYKNIEIIAIDDNSKDDSFKILKSFKKTDKRLRVFRNVKKYGIAVCFNRAIKLSKGQFIAFMDAKDKSFMHRIKKQLNFLLENPKTVAVGAQCIITNQNNKRIKILTFPEDHDSICQTIIKGVSLKFETAMVNRFLLPKDLLKFKEKDYPFLYIDLFLRLIPYGKLANLPEILHYYRRIKESETQNAKNIISLLKLWIKSRFVYEFRPPLYSLFKPTARIRIVPILIHIFLFYIIRLK